MALPFIAGCLAAGRPMNEYQDSNPSLKNIGGVSAVSWSTLPNLNIAV